jgi:hypothetical protein
MNQIDLAAGDGGAACHQLVDRIRCQHDRVEMFTLLHPACRIHSADGRPHRARYEAEQARKIREGR